MPGPEVASRKVAPAACLLLLSLAPVGACQDPGELTDAEKRTRIDEMYEGYRRDFPDAPEMTVATLVRRLAGPEPPVVVDVRSDEERDVSTIPGALSREEFEGRQAELSGREVVTYCTIGYRSGLYTEKLRGQGWNASNLRGSILAWAHAGQALERGGEPTKRVHVYGRSWNLLPEGYEPVW
jgi:rhodanese-related sulfurtransferase